MERKGADTDSCWIDAGVLAANNLIFRCPVCGKSHDVANYTLKDYGWWTGKCTVTGERIEGRIEIT